MIARSPREAHRAATPLELFFDLVFVVAIAQAASGLHHAIAEAHALTGLIGYLMVFFAIQCGGSTLIALSTISSPAFARPSSGATDTTWSSRPRAAVGAGLAVAVDQATHHAKVSAIGAGAAVAIPVAVYLLCLWFLHDRPEYRQTRLLGPLAAVMVLLTPLTGHTVPLTGAILAALVAVKLVMRRQQRDSAPVAAL